MTRARLYAEMDSDEIAEWMAYYRYCGTKDAAKEKTDITLREKFKSIMGGAIDVNKLKAQKKRDKKV